MAVAMEQARAGSSPLARGLLDGLGLVGDRPRIIPARAGFTNGMRWPHDWSADHPRSRGVYLLYAVERASARGSSPLARGLPH